MRPLLRLGNPRRLKRREGDGSQTAANLGRALTRLRAPQTAPHLSSAYHSEHRNVERRYRGRQAQQDPLAILVEILTTEVIDTTTTAIRHEALFFSFCCPPHRDQPHTPLQPQLCDSCPCEPDLCEIGSVLQPATNHDRHSGSVCNFPQHQAVRTAAQDGVHSGLRHQQD